VLCLFPFEPEIYQEFGVNAAYTGHPMADEIPADNDKKAARLQLGLNPDQNCIAILPGSRQSEAELLSKPCLEAAAILAGRDASTGFIAPMAGDKVRTVFETELRAHPSVNCQLLDGQARLAMAAADVVICASGTAALETMLVNRPMVVVYRLNPITYFIIRTLKLVKSRFFSLPNTLANEELVPELGQHAANAENIAAETIAWLENPQRCEQLNSEFSRLHSSLRTDAAASAAQQIQFLLDQAR
jgi:lipid-A-disaccharide synthase